MNFYQNQHRIPLLQQQPQIAPQYNSSFYQLYLILSFLITNAANITYFISINQYYSIGYPDSIDLDINIFMFSYLCVLVIRGIIYPIQSILINQKKTKYAFIISILCPYNKYANVAPSDRSILSKAYKTDIIVIILQLISGLGATIIYTFFCYQITVCIKQLKWFFLFSVFTIGGGIFQILVLIKSYNSFIKQQKIEKKLRAQTKAYIYKIIKNHQRPLFNQKYKKPSIIFSLVGCIAFLAILFFCIILYSYCRQHYYLSFNSSNYFALIFVSYRFLIFVVIIIMLLKLIIIPIIGLGCGCCAEIKIFILLSVLFPQLKYYKTAQRNIYFNQTLKTIFKIDLFCVILQFQAFVFGIVSAAQLIYQLYPYRYYEIINRPTYFTYVMAVFFIISTSVEIIYYYYYRAYFKWALNAQSQSHLYTQGEAFNMTLKSLNENYSYELLKQQMERLSIKIPIQVKKTGLNIILVLISCLINTGACILYFFCICQYYDFMRQYENVFAYQFLFCYIGVIVIRGFLQVAEGLVSENSSVHFKLSLLVSFLCPCLKYFQGDNFNQRKILRKTHKLDIIATILLILSGLAAFIGYILFQLGFNPISPGNFFLYKWWIVFSILTVIGGIYQLLLLINIKLIVNSSLTDQIKLEGVRQAYIHKIISKLDVHRLQQIQQYPNKLKQFHFMFRFIGLIGFVIFPLWFYVMYCYRHIGITPIYSNILANFIYWILLFLVLIGLLLKTIIIPIYDLQLNPRKNFNDSILLTIFCPQYKYFTIAEQNIIFNKYLKKLHKFDMVCIILNLWIFALAIFCGFNFSYQQLYYTYYEYPLPKVITYIIAVASLLSAILQGIFYYNYNPLFCLGMKIGKYQKMMKQGYYLKDALDKIQEKIKMNKEINFSQDSRTKK